MAVDGDLVISLLEGKALPLPAGDHTGKSLTEVFGEGSGLVTGARQALAGQDVHAVFEAGPAAYDVSLVPVRDEHAGIVGVVGVAIDVSDRLKAERALKSSEMRYRSMFENAAQGIFQSDPSGRFIGANPALARIYGYDSPDALMHAIPDLGSLLYVDKGQREEFLTRLRAGKAAISVETQVCRKDGTALWVAGTAHAVSDEHGDVVSYEGTLYDVTERKGAETERERQLIEALQQADRDPLTGLYNHRAFHLRVQLESERARREQLPLSAVMLTVRDLRPIADEHGRTAAEQLVMDVAEALRQCSRTYDTISRYDVGVFALLMPGVGLAEAHTVAERLKRQVEHRVTFQPQGARHAVPVSLGCGVAVYPAEGANPLDVLEIALRRTNDAEPADLEPENHRVQA
jgi:diguanylate cyclase (GGDEF)-like protein/PAS domain S-box-containing protein